VKLILGKKQLSPKAKLKAGFFLYGDAPLRVVQEGMSFYPYVGTDGKFELFGGFFKKPLTDEVYRSMTSAKFKDAADYIFQISPTDFMGAFALKGCRIDPSYVAVKKATVKEMGDQKGVYIEGEMVNAYDPRLQSLDPSEATEHGVGEFSLDNMLALYDGSYFYAPMSPMSEQVKKLADQQKSLFEKYSESNLPEDKKALDESSHLLKGHAGEFYHQEDDVYYFINEKGQWQALNLTGNRPLNFLDKAEILGYAEQRGIIDSDVDYERTKSHRAAFHKLPVYDRFDFDNVLPLLAPHLKEKRTEIQDEMSSYLKKMQAVKPSDISSRTIAGLKEGTEFYGHQGYTVGCLDIAPRLPVDADPGAGKTLMQIADILQQIEKNKMKKPLVVVFGSLVEQFATEVKNFSDLNPWIITTDSINTWKKGDTDAFLDEAAKAPDNTVFITSYTWLAMNPKAIPNGQVAMRRGQYKYKEIKVFENPYKLLNKLKVDGVYADEFHVLKNESNISQAISAFQKLPIVRGLTGTLMPGNLLDIVGPCGFVQSSMFGTPEKFLNKYSKNGDLNDYKEEAPKQIRERLKSFGVPQIRSTAWGYALPKVHRRYHFVSFTPQQAKVYADFLAGEANIIENDPVLAKAFLAFKLSLDEGEPVIAENLLQRFKSLDLFLNAPSKVKKIGALLSGDDTVSPKSAAINKICSEHLGKPDNGKVIIFTQFSESAHNIIRHLDPQLREQAVYYDAGKVDELNRFKIEGMSPKIIVGVDQSLRTGHNLQVANCVIHADTLWTSGDMRQRQDRAARLKQTREVFVHHIIVENSAEILKNARIISQEHMIAKANSDYEDKDVIPHVAMSLASMQSEQGEKALVPYIDRQKKIENFKLTQRDVEKELYGSRTMAPASYKPLDRGEKLNVVPSTKNFEGNSNKNIYIKEEELKKLPNEPENPKRLKFNLQKRDREVYLTCFKVSDPQGFVRRLGFSLQSEYMYIEVPAKGGVTKLVHDLEAKNVEIINKENLEEGIATGRIRPAKQGALKQLERESKQKIAGAKEPKKAEPLLIEFHFATIDGYPLVYTDSVREGSDEMLILQRLHFKDGAPYWYLNITRTKLATLFKKIQHSYPDLRIVDWEAFKADVSKIFRFDLAEFDILGDK